MNIYGFLLDINLDWIRIFHCTCSYPSPRVRILVIVRDCIQDGGFQTISTRGGYFDWRILDIGWGVLLYHWLAMASNNTSSNVLSHFKFVKAICHHSTFCVFSPFSFDKRLCDLALTLEVVHAQANITTTLSN